jgi:hypothetical protein
VYQWQAWVEKGSEKHLVDSGQTKCKAALGPVNASAVFDGRSEIKKILDAIDAAIKKKATADQLEYVIGSRQLRRYSMTELIALRTQYAKLYSQELRAEKLKQGAPFFKNINVRFVEPD